MHKHTLHFKTAKLRLVLSEQIIVDKIVIDNTVKFNSFVDFEWSYNGLVDCSNF